MIRTEFTAARNKFSESRDPESVGMRRLLARLVHGETLSWKEVLAVTPETKKPIQSHRPLREREPCDALAA
jgi:hypothetical protein